MSQTPKILAIMFGVFSIVEFIVYFIWRKP